MQAIILAAGMGKRLKNLTPINRKCMVRVTGVALIERMLHQSDYRHLSRIIIVIGYEGQKIVYLQFKIVYGKLLDNPSHLSYHKPIK